MQKVNKFQIWAVLWMFMIPRMAWALPTGETVVSGSATFSNAPASMTINQSTDKAIIEYNSFSIDAAESVIFAQPSSTSIALNRVTGVDPSLILGLLSANGRIFLINPNGVIFGYSAVVDTSGLIASTLDIADSNLLSGNFVFSGSGGAVENFGYLSSPGGFVALLGSSVQNQGWIQADAGEVALVAGHITAVSLDADGIFNIAVLNPTASNSSGAVDAVLNTGAILTGSSGTIMLSANVLNGLFDHAINNQGVIEANQIGPTGGTVSMEAAGADTLLDGTIMAGSVRATNSTDDTVLSGDIMTHGAVTVVSQGNLTHDYASSIVTHDGAFQGNAGGSYEIKNGTRIDTGSGTIDIYAAGNVLIGSLLETVDEYSFDWYYNGGFRDGQFQEFGYYYDNAGVLIRVPFVSGEDIGKDGVSPTFGSEVLSGGIPDGFYGAYVAHGSQDWSTDPALNNDGYDHYHEIGNILFAEDLPADVTDADFEDVILNFEIDETSSTVAPRIHTTGNFFITAQNGFIRENHSDISAGNLILNAEEGITGHGTNGGFVADTSYLSAYNGTSGELNFEDPNSFTVSDLSALNGLNDGVTGFNGVTNRAIGEDADLVAGEDVIVEAPVHVYGDLTITAGHDIVQQDDGNITIHQFLIDKPEPGPLGLDSILTPVNLHSTTHIPGVASNPDHNITVQWQLPDAEESYYDFVGVAGHDYIQQPSTALYTHGGDATITADRNVELALVSAYNGTANITAQNSSIIDADQGTAPSDYDVIANTINLNAPNGNIGGASPDEIDLGYPGDGFSYVWNQSPIGAPNASIDDFMAFLNDSHQWVFETVFTAPDNTTDWWFHVVTVDTFSRTTSPTGDIGPFVFETTGGPGDGDPGNPGNPGGPGSPGSRVPGSFSEFGELLSAYYEILDTNQFAAFEPIQPIGFYAYHPITSTDQTAIDGIKLDEGAFEFIDDQLKERD